MTRTFLIVELTWIWFLTAKCVSWVVNIAQPAKGSTTGVVSSWSENPICPATSVASYDILNIVLSTWYNQSINAQLTNVETLVRNEILPLMELWEVRMQCPWVPDVSHHSRTPLASHPIAPQLSSVLCTPATQTVKTWKSFQTTKI